MKIILFAATLFLSANVRGVPFRPTDPVEIEGVIKEFVWIDASEFKHDSSDAGRILYGSWEPPRYYIVLESDSMDADERDSYSIMAGVEKEFGLSHPIMRKKLGEKEILIRLAILESSDIKTGETLTVKGYRISGSELGANTHFEKLLIDGKEIEIEEQIVPDKGRKLHRKR